MKVLMFGWEFPPLNSGGLGVACQGLTRSLTSRNVDVKFVLPRKADISSEFMEFDFANQGRHTVKYIPIHSELHNPYQTSLLNGYNDGKPVDGYDLELMDRVFEYELNAINVALRQDFDVIHAHDWLSFGAGIRTKQLTGKPLIAHIHATEFDRGGGQGINQTVYELEKKGLKHADKVIAVSQYTKNMVIDRYGVEAGKVEVVHNGIDISEIPHHEVAKMNELDVIKSSGYDIVLYLGRLTIQKNLENLLKAAKTVLDHHKKTFFVFAGSGDMEKQLIEMAVEMGISDKVIFTGFVRGLHKHRLYKMADVFVMPSVSEPFGLVPLEALANNTPVLVSHQSGVSEVLANALKVDFWDTDEMVNKIVAVLRHSSLKETLAEQGHKEVHGITWDRAAERVQRVYDELVVSTKG